MPVLTGVHRRRAATRRRWRSAGEQHLRVLHGDRPADPLPRLARRPGQLGGGDAPHAASRASPSAPRWRRRVPAASIRTRLDGAGQRRRHRHQRGRRGERLDHPGCAAGTRRDRRGSAPWSLAPGTVDVAGLAPRLVDQRLLVVADHRRAEPGGDAPPRVEVEPVRPPARHVRGAATPCCRRPAARPPARLRRRALELAAQRDRPPRRRPSALQASMAPTGCSAPSSGATRPSTSPVTAADVERQRAAGRRQVAGRQPPGQRLQVAALGRGERPRVEHRQGDAAAARAPGRRGAARIRRPVGRARPAGRPRTSARGRPGSRWSGAARTGRGCGRCPSRASRPAASSWTWAHSASWSCGGSWSACTSTTGHCAPAQRRRAAPARRASTISASHGRRTPRPSGPAGVTSHGIDGVVNSIDGNTFGGMLREPGAGSRRRTCWAAIPVMSPGP